MPTEVLYRKYRPDTFSKLVGQDNLRELLTSQISNNKISHGYLFTGPRGTGKTTAARLFAKAINCLEWAKSNDVCNECEHCVLFNSGAAIDFIEIDAASNRGIDEIRKIKEASAFLPLKFRYKTYVIDEAHMLTKDAFNSLLKILEEAPKHVVFILATTEIHKVPLTVASRLQRFDFKLANKDVLDTKLNQIAASEGWELETGLLAQIYRISGGSFRDAESLLTKITPMLGSKRSTADILEAIGLPTLSTLEALASNLMSSNSAEVTKIYLSMRTANIEPLIIMQQLMDLLVDKLNEESSQERVINILNALSEKYTEVKYGYNPDKVLQLVLVSLARKESGSFLANKATNANNEVETQSVKTTEEFTVKVSQTQSDVKRVPTKSLEPVKIEEPIKEFVAVEDAKIFSAMVSKLRNKNLRLANMVQNCELLSVENKLIKVATNLILSYEILNKSASKQLIGNILKELTNDSWQFVCEKTDKPVVNMAKQIEPDEPAAEGMAPEPETDSPQPGKLSNKNLVEAIFN